MMNPAAQNCVAWWTMNETSGIRYDSAKGNHLTPINAAQTYATGVRGNAADFANGADDTMSAPDSTDLSVGSADFTLACWVKFAGVSASQAIVVKGETDESDDEYALWFYSLTGLINITFRNAADSGSSTQDNDYVVISADTWYFVMFWHDETNQKRGLRVNDVDVESPYSAGVRDGTNDLKLGNDASDSFAEFEGQIDELCIFDTALNSLERDWLYNDGNGRTFADLANHRLTAR